MSHHSDKKRWKHRNSLTGLILLALGFFFLAKEFFPGTNVERLWPIILVVIGISFLMHKS